MDMFHLAEFHFLRPLWLVAIIPLILLVVMIAFLHKRQSGWQSVLAGHLYPHLVTSENTRRTKPPLYLLAVGWLLATLALAGPTWERLPQPVYQLHSGKVVVIDMSLSMRATDVKPNRLTRARYKAIDLVNAIAEGETGLVAYAGDAFTISPLSTDAQNLTTLIPSLTPEIMPVEGSEPYLGLLAAIELLTNAGYQQGEIFWITDGIENNQVNEVNKLLRNTPFRVSVLGVGTEDGAPIKLTNGDFMKDSQGAIVLPKLSVSNLRTLAKSGRGRYIAMSADDEDIDYLKNQSLLERQSEQQDEQSADNFGDKWKEMGPYLLLLILPLAAYGFRRGLVSLFVLSMLFPLYSPTANASGLTDMWKTKDQQGQQAMVQQDFAGAAEVFDDPMWRGTAYYKNKDYQQALESFRQSDSTDALYNQGNALAQLGDLEHAIATYDKVLAQDPTHADAKVNKALLEQQQQDKQQQGDENKDGQDDQSDGQEQEQSSPGEESPGEESPPEEQNSDSQSGQDNQGQPNEPASDSPPDKDKEQEGDSDPREQTEQLSESEPQTKEGQQVAQPAEMTDQEKEQMQRMQTLLNKVPDDPAFLLKRKMQIESQQRQRQRMPTQLQRNW